MPVSTADLATLSRLLDAALELAPERREGWLAALPPAERHLADALRAMLAQSDRTRSAEFLSTLPPLTGVDAATAQAGERVGAYRLIREIGRGGMGEVWLAERADGAFRRHVALKLPRMAWGAGLAQRMAREREIGALLEHPNIARMYDAGVDERGRPFLALEYIDGQPIDTWCAAQALSIRARLQLVAQVAHAVAYAHGRLVVHRDLKPSNVLVTADGQAHLLDFGIATLLMDSGADASGLTQDLGRVLTPHYASPEQARGEAVTVQSDVYSLGALAYELLAGALPWRDRQGVFAGGASSHADDEAPLASRVTADPAHVRPLRGDVDAILAKALRFDPGQRYTSAQALAVDIERHLGGEPIGARPSRRWHPWRRFARRHRVPLVALGAVLAVAAIGAGATVIQARQAVRAAEREALIRQFVSDVFRGGPDPKSGAAASAPKTPERLLEQGAATIEQRFPGRPDLQASLYEVVGGIFSDMGAPQLATDYLQREVGALARVDAQPEALARARLRLGEALLESGRVADAQAQAQAAVAEASASRELSGDSTVLLARALARRGELASSARARDRAAALFGDRETPATIGRARLFELDGQVSEQPETRLALFEQGMAVARRAEGANSRTAALIELQLAGNLLFSEDQATERRGLALHEAACAILDGRGGADAVRASMARARLFAITLQMPWSSPAQSLAGVRAARQALEAGPLAVPPVLLAQVDFYEGMILQIQGRVSDAGPLLLRGIAGMRQGEPSPGSLRFVAFIESGLRSDLGDHDEADRLLRESIRLRALSSGGVMPLPVIGPVWLAQNRMMQGRLDAAGEILDAARRDALPPAVRSTAILAVAQARLQLLRGDAAGAARIVAQANAHDLATEFADDAYRPMSLDALRAEILCASGHADEGRALLDSAIAKRASRADIRDPEVARRRAVAGQCALALHRRDDARALARQAHEAFALQPGVSDYFKRPLAVLDAQLAGQ